MNFSYNLLSLPREVNYWPGGNSKIKYYYTFDGEKLRKTVENNGIVTKVDYCGPFVYETASGVRSLKYFVTPEGRAVKNGSAWDYEYNLKDHLGNTRVVIRKGGSGLAEVIQERHYYPFGMEMSELSYGTGSNRYLYNSKEIQNDFDLYWYDYGARFYDPELGRWHAPDGMSEKHYDNTFYIYTLNNPILFIDPFGLDTFNINIHDNTINRITVKDSESHTYIISDEEKYLSIFTLDINEFGLIQFQEEGSNRSRYGFRDQGGDNLINPETAGAFFGLLYRWSETTWGNNKVLFDDISGYKGQDIGHITHRTGDDIDIRYFGAGAESNINCQRESTASH